MPILVRIPGGLPSVLSDEKHYNYHKILSKFSKIHHRLYNSLNMRNMILKRKDFVGPIFTEARPIMQVSTVVQTLHTSIYFVDW